jgi:DNA-binding beta-propeller fold protein YncE
LSRRRLRRRLASLAVALATAAAVDAAEPVFLKRLSLPVSGDDIAYGHCVTADPHTGELFVCDPRTNRILIFDRDGYFDFQILGGSELSSPEDLAVDPEGLLLVVARRGAGPCVLELDFDGLFRRQIELEGLPAGIAPPEIGSLALAPAGDRLVLADGANSMLWITDRDGLVLTAVDLAEGQPEEERRNWGPGHVDAYGDRVVVTVPMQGQVRVYSAAGELVGTVGVRGSGPGQLGYPTAAAIDVDGDLLVLDSQRMMVSRWRIAGNRFLSEHLGLGNLPGFLYFPHDLALDPRGRFYVAQSADGRVQVYEGLGAAPAPPPR